MTAALLPGPAARAQDPERVIREGFKDDFEFGKLDNRLWFTSDGWSNGDWMDCSWSREAVAVTNGRLHLSRIPARSAGGTPLCGEVQSADFIRYGTVEARIRTPRASGFNASVFTYSGPVHGLPHGEIDIEILTRSPDEVALNTYVEGKPVNGATTPISPPLDEAFHTVAMRWEPQAITWYIDGLQVHRTAPGSPLPDQPQKIFMSLWGTTVLTDWMGHQEPTVDTLTYEVDWLAYTPLDQSCLFAGSITC